MSAKAETDPKDKLKTTPLHLAAKEGHVTAVETLIEHNASVTSEIIVAIIPSTGLLKMVIGR